MTGFKDHFSSVSVKCYRVARGCDPLLALMAELAPGWGDPETAQKLQWLLFLRVGRA